MKTTGIILIIFSGTGLGLCKSMELSGRLKILERLAQLLLLLKGEIRCTGASLEDAFLDVAKKMPGEYRLFLEETAGRIGERSGIAFEVIFRECAFKCLPSGRGIKGTDPGTEKRDAEAAENVPEHGNSGRDSACCADVVMPERRSPWKSVLFLKLLL